MSFCFNFSIDKEDDQDHRKDDKVRNKHCEEKLEEAREIFISNQKQSLEEYDYGQIELVLPSGETLLYIDSEQVEDALMTDRTSERSDGVATALEASSDLIPNIYEGGLKVWECSVDLVNYLSSSKIAFRGLKVLEIGCGAALPGIWAYTQGANVTLQDYNWEVLEHITVSNILLNTPEEEDPATRCRFVAGDWSKVERLIINEWMKDSQEKYDMILTSETIYSSESYHKLLHLMEMVLKPSGTVYLAAKTYYFGVGGGVRDFEENVKRYGAFHIEVVKEFTEGVQREILKLELINKKNAEKQADSGEMAKKELCPVVNDSSGVTGQSELGKEAEKRKQSSYNDVSIKQSLKERKLSESS